MFKKKTLMHYRARLFGDFKTSLTTIVVTIPVLVLFWTVLKFVFVQGRWQIVTQNLRLFYLGTYPMGEEWRVWLPLYFLACIVGLSFGMWAKSLNGYLRGVGVISILLLVLGLEPIPRWLNAFSLGLAVPFGTAWLLTLGLVAVAVATAVGGRRVLTPYRHVTRLHIALGASWLAPILLAVILQRVISPNRWNGIFLDIMVFSVGAVISFPVGVLLALGRSSPLPVIRISSTAYIEIVRAGPLVVWLILSLFLWNEFFFETNKVHRGMLVFGFFGAAYLSEVIRGGLQSIPKGQYEASQSLGLRPFSVYVFVILPQAIKAVVPALIGRFISLWKDTSLLIALSLINTLEVSSAILEGDPSNGQYLLEIYLIIALFYWIVSFALSRLGTHIERSMAQ